MAHSYAERLAARQREIAEAVERHGGNYAAAARELEVNESVVRRSMGRQTAEAKARVELLQSMGIEPTPTMAIAGVHTIRDGAGNLKRSTLIEKPEAVGLPGGVDAGPARDGHSGFSIRGVSTYFDAEGNPRGQWLKTRAEDAHRENVLRAIAQELKADLPQYPPVEQQRAAPKELLNLFTVTDFHFGMLAWHEETGQDWNLSIADRTLDAAIQTWVKRVPAAGEAILNFGGDNLHYDSLKPVTPASGHILDADSRMRKIVRVAMAAVRRTVTQVLQTHGRVTLLWQEGNHDETTSLVIQELLAWVYEADPRVNVVSTPSPYYAHEHGQWMLGFHHGHLKKPDNLPLLFASKFREMWGRTARAHIHCGHMHHLYECEHPGALVTQHPTLAAPDAYAARGGWLSERGALAHTYHADGRMVCVTPVAPALAELAA